MSTIDEAVEALKDGKFVLIHDSESRENEVDMVKAAQYISSSDIATMRTDAGGLICLAIPYEIASKLNLIFMHDLLHSASKNNPSLSKMIGSIAPYGDRPSFSITINHIDTFTGITDKDRALTITTMSEVCSKIDKDGKLEFLKKFRSPGHVHMLIGAKELLKERSGHTELSIKLLEHANLIPAVVICEMLDSKTGGALSANKATEYSKKFKIPFVESSQIKKI
ncbi:MAG TPA: 3,4-dihydroxy-2-butanone-4-phosphate synthase [Nitrososphaeraceae archaeon]|nr:3,4-dihydroxy-2-butanone-4-phosphate synthase [Nitrososphaeraceae archaeon]